MILWEMATMTKPFEMMGREEFFREVVRADFSPQEQVLLLSVVCSCRQRWTVGVR